MKLKNRILIVFFTLVLLLCFTFVSSAKDYIEYEGVFIKNHTYYTEVVWDDTLDFGFVYFHRYISYDGPSDYIFGLLNIDKWYDFFGSCSSHEVFFNKLISYSEAGLIDDMSQFGGMIFGNSQQFYNLYVNSQNVKTYDEGVQAGMNQSFSEVQNWLDLNDLLIEPDIYTGLSSFGSLLDQNLPYAFNNYYSSGYTAGLIKGADEAYPSAYADGVNAALTRLEDWLFGKNILFYSYSKDGDTATVDEILEKNVVSALEISEEQGYNRGLSKGQTLGNTQMYNELVGHINDAFGTEYSLSDGTSFDFKFPYAAYSVAFEKGELYQYNKFTDDGGISDFLADISGTVLSTFFYLGTNISFMGTTALSLISLFVIAAIVIFILKFVLKG